METEDICQVHYVITTTVSDKRNIDLEGKFHITSTWKMVKDTWKLVFNMDSRIIMYTIYRGVKTIKHRRKIYGISEIKYSVMSGLLCLSRDSRRICKRHSELVRGGSFNE